MTLRNSPSMTAQEMQAIEAVQDAIASAMTGATELYGQWLEMQASLWASWLNGQAAYVRELRGEAGDLPPWMVWFNGPEQLA